MFKNFIYKYHLDEIDTSDAYFGKLLFRNNAILIPYINMGISNHILNKENHLQYIDYCYFIAVDLKFLKINNDIIINKLPTKIDPLYSINLGGWDMLENQNVYDIEVQSDEKFIQLIDNSKISKEMWVPIETPNFRKNMNKDKVELFINNKELPINLLQLFT